MSFSLEVLFVDERTVIALKYVERMHYPDGEDLTADILTGDLHIEVTMISGEVHCISMNQMKKCYSGLGDKTPEMVRNLIYDRWTHLLGRN